jgi:molecular chaperone GrpE (heat shock protein)
MNCPCLIPLSRSILCMDENSAPIDFTPQLRQLMAAVAINNFTQLARMTGTSTHTIRKLRSGKLATLRWQALVNLSTGLQISVSTLLHLCGDRSISPAHQQLAALQQEYHHLHQQLQHQRETLQSEFQYQSLQTLESFLTYFPTARHAAINNPDFPASKLLPLVKSIEQLVSNWHVTAIGIVGESIDYDPQCHQLIDGIAQPGDPVTIRYVGYKQHDQLLFRAKVRALAC